ncbi:MAG: hypothetical protein ABSD85_16355 [Acidimicrobiales bacterium]|jgi:hypothetical protein
MVMNELDWPDVGFVRVEVESSAQWSNLRELRPLFSRQPYGDWCQLFSKGCEEDPSIKWKDAGFARCKPADVNLVEERFRVATASANTIFREVLARVLENQPRKARDLIALEASLAASDNGDGCFCNF